MYPTHTEDQLQALCREWQGVMRLQDWDVKVKVVRLAAFGGRREGECTYTQSTKEALIKILDPVDWPADTEWEQDQERTLVHELEHLHFAPFMSDKGPDDPEHIAQEQAIELNACALVTLKRSRIDGT